MSVTDTQKVDLVRVDNHSGECLLTITDHLDWNDGDHLVTLLPNVGVPSTVQRS